MIQILINILISTSQILLIALSFWLLYSTTKFFNLSHAAIIIVGSYSSIVIENTFHFPLIITLIFALLFTSLIGLLLYFLVFKYFINHANNSYIPLIVSLGVYVVIENIISLLFSDNKVMFGETEVKVGNDFGGGFISDIQIIMIVSGILLFLAMIFFINRTRFGIQLKAFSNNDCLSSIFGINTVTLVFVTSIISFCIASYSGFLIAIDTGVVPSTGFNLLIYGIVAMILSGMDNIRNLLWGSLLLSSTQHLGAFFIGSNWMDTIAYILLIIFLIWKPLGFSGKQLKKIEI